MGGGRLAGIEAAPAGRDHAVREHAGEGVVRLAVAVGRDRIIGEEGVPDLASSAAVRVGRVQVVFEHRAVHVIGGEAEAALWAERRAVSRRRGWSRSF